MSQKKKPTTGRDERGRFTKDHKIGETTRFEKENAAACKYKEEYADMIIDYFGQPSTRVEYSEVLDKNGNVKRRTPIIVPNEYPTFEAFAAKIGVITETLRNWCDQSPRFRHAYARAKEMQKGKLISNTLGGNYNPLFAKFEAINNHGMSDKTATDNTVSFNIKLSDEIDEEAN